MRGPPRGYNHDVRYRGRVFHVQSEVSAGVRQLVCTQLFVGGTVLATERSSIGEAMTSDDIDAVLRSQHKAVLRELCRGAFDAWIDHDARQAATDDGAATRGTPSAAYRFIPPPIPR